MDGVATKVERAKEHLGELEAFVFGNFSFDPFVEEVITDRASCSYLVTVRQPAPPLRLAAVFGDVLHNLRSALDYLARDLVIANGNTPIDRMRGTTFPILEKQPTQLIDIVPGISTGARRALDSVQPYLLGEKFRTSSLWELSQLENADKHRLLHVAIWAGNGRLSFGPSATALVLTETTATYTVRLDDPAPQRVQVDPLDLYDSARAGGSWVWHLVLAEPLNDLNPDLICIARKLVRHVTDDVLPAFDDCRAESQ